MKFPRLVLLSLAAIAVLGGCGKSTSVTSSTPNTPSLDTTPPPVPEQLSLSSDPLTSGGVLVWSASSAPDVAGYQVFEFAPNPWRDDSYTMVFESTGETRWAVHPVTTRTVKYFRVAAVDENGNRSALSAVYEVTLSPTPRVQEPGPGRMPFEG